MPPSGAALLCVPSNERLCGTQFAHFPVGGPTPVAELIGEREIPPDATGASRMLYQCESVDGAVTEFSGGAHEAIVRERVPVLAGGDPKYPVRCATGNAVWVPATGALEDVFRRGLVLAVPPFWPGRPTADWRRLLGAAYESAFSLATGPLATPLLGAGARGAPAEHAAAVATEAAASFVNNPDSSEANVLFSVQDDDVADILDAALDRVL